MRFRDEIAAKIDAIDEAKELLEVKKQELLDLHRDLIGMVHLESVGAFIDSDGLIYTEQVDGSPDMGELQQAHVDDAPEEWFEGLSEKDSFNVGIVQAMIS